MVTNTNVKGVLGADWLVVTVVGTIVIDVTGVTESNDISDVTIDTAGTVVTSNSTSTSTSSNWELVREITSTSMRCEPEK